VPHVCPFWQTWVFLYRNALQPPCPTLLVRWFDHKYGKERQQHDWVKCHLMCGVKTNIVTAVEIHDRNASDTKLLPTMLDSTARNFRVSEVSADKGYASIKNAGAIASHGATPYISFQSGHSGAGGGAWGQMYHYFMFRRDEFLGALSQAVERRIHVFHDETEVRGFFAKQDRYCNG
jgi:hypothetical protein